MKKMPRILYLALFLLALGVIAGGLLSFVNSITAPVIEENATKELEKTLEAVNVKNPTDITSKVKLVGGVKTVYSGECDGKKCYVYNVSNTNKYTTVNVLVVISSENGRILNINVSGTPSITTHGFDSSFVGDLNVIGSTNSNNLKTVTGATFSRDSIKKCLDDAFATFSSAETQLMKGAE